MSDENKKAGNSKISKFTATTVKTRPFDIQAMTGNKPSTQSNSNIIGGNNLDNGRNNKTNK